MNRYLLLPVVADRLPMALKFLDSVDKYLPESWFMVAVAQEFPEEALQTLRDRLEAARPARPWHLLALPERVGPHRARQAGVRWIAGREGDAEFVICSVDDDMEFLPETNFEPAVEKALLPHVGLVSTNWVRERKFVKPEKVKHEFTAQGIVYTGGGMVFSSKIARLVMAMPEADYYTDNTAWALEVYLNGYTNLRYRGSLSLHLALSAGGRKGWVSLKPGRVLTDPKYFPMLPVKGPARADGYSIGAPKDLTPLAHAVHRANLKKPPLVVVNPPAGAPVPPPQVGKGVMLFGTRSVLEAARERISYVFDEFDDVWVCVSGGKDSTVIYHLALEEAERRGRLPLPVMWIDQEAEWDCVVRYVRGLMNDPRVRPVWFQGQFRLNNATSFGAPMAVCWQEGAEWIRPKEPNSIHQNTTGEDIFYDLFSGLVRQLVPGKTVARLGGVRAEESPARRIALTSQRVYKDVTWGKRERGNPDQFVFYPIFDWSYRDVWKAIHEHGWRYCELYDWMFQRGISVRDMRVSNVHHETAVKSLEFMQEIEPETWNRLTARLSSTNIGKQVPEMMTCPKVLPWMFRGWDEYRDFLLDRLITDPKHRAWFAKTFRSSEKQYGPELLEKLRRTHVKMILRNDIDGTLWGNFRSQHAAQMLNRGKRNKWLKPATNPPA